MHVTFATVLLSAAKTANVASVLYRLARRIASAPGARVAWHTGFLLAVASTIHAQDVPQVLRVRLESSQGELPPINLRPNTSTAVSVFLHNPMEDEYRNVTVKFVQLDRDSIKILAQAEVAKLPPREEVRLLFPARGKEAPEKMDLIGPPFKTQLWIEPKQKDDFTVIKRDISLLIREPRDYLTAQAQYDAIARKLSFKLRREESRGLIGPKDCPVELALGAEFAEPKKGAFKQVIVGAKSLAEVHAENLIFVAPTLREGHAYLTVDGFERAFIYPVRLTGSGDMSEVALGKKIGAKIVVPRYAVPAAKFPVRLELDGPLDAEYRVELGLDRAGTREQFNQRVQFNGLREQKARIGIAPTGDLLCQTEVRDWQVEFDTTGVFGNIWFRLEVFKKDRFTGKFEERELSIPPFVAAHRAPLRVDADLKRAYARVIQDRTPPEDVEFVDLPRAWSLGKPMPLFVKTRERGDHQAPIEKLLLLRGKAPQDGKINPDFILGSGVFDEERSLWQVTMPPQEKIELLEFSAILTTGTGVSASRSATISIVDPTAGGKGIAKVTGKLTYGPNPVPNASVSLLDEKGVVKGSVKSTPKGEYAFDKVPPGNYVVYATQSFPALVGRANVQVPEGKELVEKIDVRLLSK